MRLKSGFTLVELAIVLVIIGLLVGGVLQGQELIKQAKLRAQMKQFESIQASIYTFKAKYNCDPGRCTDGVSLGVGGSLITAGFSLITGPTVGCDETELSFTGSCPSFVSERLFFLNLRTAGLFNGPPADGNYHEKAALSNGLLSIIVRNDGTNKTIDIVLHGNMDGNVIFAATLTPSEAQTIDQKMDNGMPTSGNIISGGAFNTWGPNGDSFTAGDPYYGQGSAGSKSCMNSDVTPFQYNTSYNGVVCNISMEVLK